MLSFFDRYELCNSTTNLQERYVKGKEGKRCRFCGKSEPDVTFLTRPHILPELFGRNITGSNFECDECNRRFQKYESDTSTLVQHHLAMLNIKTKNGVPVFQSSKRAGEKSTIVRSNGGQRVMNFDTNLDDFKYDEANKTLTVWFRTRNFRPYSVYKVFLKVAISLLSEAELKANSHFLEFLNADEPIVNGMQVWTAFRYIQKTKYRPEPQADLYKAKATLIENAELPEYVLIISFGTLVFQMFLPVSNKNIEEHSKERTLALELFPSFYTENIYALNSIEIHHLDLSETKKVSITDKVVMYYNKKTRSSPPKEL